MRSTKDHLAKEQRTSPLVMSLLLASALTGLVTYAVDAHNVPLQWTVLAHLILGIACSLALLPYFVSHFRRTIGYRRTSLLLSGLTTIPLFLVFIGSGWHLLLLGQLESAPWVLPLHIYSAVAFLSLIVLHIAFHSQFMPQKRKATDGVTYNSLPTGGARYILLFNSALAAMIAVAAAAYQALDPAYTNSAAVDNYELSYGQHPFRPSQTETDGKRFVDERQIANSHRCLNCHKDIGQQWLSSVHQQAAADPTYVTNINLLEKNKGISATRYCEGCHAPVALLTGQLSPGGKHGGVLNTPANHEGVSCMSCHGIESLPHLKGVASYKFKAAEDYLFAKSSHPWLRRVHDLLIKVKPDQHRRDLGRPVLKDPRLCSACHTQFMDKDMNDWGWVKMQDEYGAWLASPFSNQHEEDFSAAQVLRCQDCHMPLIGAEDPSANSDGRVRAHHFPGANTFLPLLRGDREQFEATVEFLQSSKLRVSIEPPNRADAIQNLQALDESIRDFAETPYYYYLGEQADLSIIVSNNGVGHDFPGGTTDINEAWLEFKVVDAQGTPVFHSGALTQNNEVEPNAYFYRSIPIDRNGKHVWKHDLFNMVGESFRRVIKAGESDLVRFQFTVPSWAKSPLTVTATLNYRKLNERYARWALDKQYIEIPVVNMAWDSLSIPIKIRREVE